LKNAIGRVEASWRPASPDEGFEIVRRRLFQPLTGEQFVARDAVARAFSELYGSQQQEFPLECREADYERRVKLAYPIHPELFDRLYNDWSTLEKFQRTRGVLRLMAAVIHALWERNDANLLIMPATVPVDEPIVHLGSEHPHSAREETSPARKEAASILESRGTSPRNYKNTLVFLAADTIRLRELEQAVRQYLAWSSIWDDRTTLNLDPFQSRQAETKRQNTDETVDARIPETYQWLLVPGQPDPKGGIQWTEIRLQGQEPLAPRAGKKLKNEELLMVQLGGTRLRHEIDKIPLWRGDHVGIQQLCEDMARYLYLPRVRDEDVILAAVRDGLERLTWQNETFAYAEGWDEPRGRYQGLRAGQPGRVVLDAESLVVQSEIAAAQIEADRQAATATSPRTVSGPETDSAAGSARTRTGSASGTGTTVAPPVRQLRRFHGCVKLDPVRLGRDAARIAEEVVQHLSGIVGADVQVTLDVQVELPQGASDKLVRDVTENCRTLRFDEFGFEET